MPLRVVGVGHHPSWASSSIAARHWLLGTWPQPAGQDRSETSLCLPIGQSREHMVFSSGRKKTLVGDSVTLMQAETAVSESVVDHVAADPRENPVMGVEIALNEDVLRAALDFVDECASAQRPKATATRRRLELIDLREQAGELRRRLSQLRRKRSGQALEWERLVACQRQRRQRAEDENDLLRSSLKKQSRAVKRLASLLGNRCWSEAVPWDKLVGSGDVQIPRPLDLLDQERLLHEAYGMYSQVSAVFEQQQFVSAIQGDTELRGVVKQKDTEFGEAVDVCDLRLMPFDFSRIGEAIWQHAMEPKIPGKHVRIQDVDVTDARLERQVKFQFRLPESGQQCDFHCHAIVLRYRLPNAVVVLWVIKNEARVALERSEWTLSTVEKVWTLTQPLETGTNVPISVTRMYGIPTPSIKSASGRECKTQPLELYRWRTDTGKDHWGEIESNLLLNQREVTGHIPRH